MNFKERKAALRSLPYNNISFLVTLQKQVGILGKYKEVKENKTRTFRLISCLIFVLYYFVLR